MLQHRFFARNLRFSGFALALALVPLGAPRLALAESSPGSQGAAKPVDQKTRDAARTAFADGQAAFKAGDHAKAVAAFQRAHSLLPTPHAEYWIAVSQAALPGKASEAVAAYELFLANPEADKVGADKVSEARAKLDELKAALLGEVQINSVPRGAAVMVNGQAQEGSTPLTLKLPAGRHLLDVLAADHKPSQLDVVVESGKVVTANVTLEPVAVEPPPVAEPQEAPPALPAAPPPAAREPSRVPAYVTLGLGGAGAVVGGIFGLRALSAKSDFNSNPTSKRADDVERNALISDMAFGVAVTLGITGIVLLTTDASSSEIGAQASPVAAKLELAPYASPTGGGAAARLTF